MTTEPTSAATDDRRTYSNTGDAVDPFGTHAIIPASEREARLLTAPTVERPVDDPLEQDGWDRLHAFGFVRCPEAVS